MIKNKNIKFTLALSIIAGVCCFGSLAGAQGLQLNRYSASEIPEDGFYMSRPIDQGHLKFGISLHLDYANDPLVYETDLGERDSESASVVGHQLTSHLALSLGVIKRLVFFTALKANLLMAGDEWDNPETGRREETADGPGLGDLTLGLRARLLGEAKDIVGLALQATLNLPTGGWAASDQRYAGEESVSFTPELLFEVRTKPMLIGLNLGANVRKNTYIEGAKVRDELTYAIGFIIPMVKDHLDGHIEFFGATPFKGFGDRENTQMEFLAGLKAYVGEKFALGLSGGMGLTRGIGSPDARAVAIFGWRMPEKKPKPKVPKDTDSDGIYDDKDACIISPEDMDGFEDEDGCPEADNDEDGVPDDQDDCPLDPEDLDEFMDEDGCPDKDNDEDGVLDSIDRCPNQPEDLDEFMDEDGCPDLDNDNDGVPDDEDDCPLDAGVPEERGCPKSVKLDVDKGIIQILERVEFATGKDIILERSEPLLREVTTVIKANIQLARIRIEGHTDNRGKDKKNMKLSKRRALSVKRWLVANGVSNGRVVAYGCGEALPIDNNKTKAGRQTNRRVEFHIIDPAPPDGPRDPQECQPAEDTKSSGSGELDLM